MKDPICYCGHDCSRCVTYLATLSDDDTLRRQSQTFYRDRLGIELPLEKLRCAGGRTEDRLLLCRDCPFIACCSRRGIASCDDCPNSPCEMLRAYRARFVNRANQL